MRVAARPATHDDGRLFSLMGGGDQLPSRIEGGLSFGQYFLIIGMNCAAGAGSQFACGAFAGFRGVWSTKRSRLAEFDYFVATATSRSARWS